MRFNFTKLITALFVMIIVQYAARWLLASLGIYGLVSSAIVDFFVAFTLVLIYTPAKYRKYALKTPQFHYNVLVYFIILFAFTLIQYLL